MARGAIILWYLGTSTLFFSAGINGAGTDESLCLAKALSSTSTVLDRSIPGLVVYKVPYRWCTANCSGWTRFSGSDIELILLQFILPTVIFALVIPRKWHLDLSPVNFDFGSGLLHALFKTLLSLVATGVLASMDMILWIGVILGLAGPMILSGIEEARIDIVAVRALESSHSSPNNVLTSEERLSIIVAILCGNLEGDRQMLSDLQTGLSNFAPVTPNVPTLGTIKARLEAIMNAQENFGAVVGIPTAFFLAGLLYNANQIAHETALGINWTPYALWLMTMVYVVIISAAPLTGNNPSVATMLVKNRYSLQHRFWCNPVANYYDEDIFPASMYDRATTKTGWVNDSMAYRNRNWFRERVKLDWWTRTLVVLSTGFTALFASIMAYSIAYRVPWPREGCRSFSYLLYIALQTMMILLRLISSIAGQPMISIPDPNAYNVIGDIWFKIWQVMYSVLMLLGFAIAFFISFAGSIFQIFGVYNNCHCRTPPQKTLENKHYADTITIAAVVVTAILCYFGWWYQKVMRRAIAVELGRL